MNIDMEKMEHIEASAEHTLATIELIASRAAEELRRENPDPVDCLANPHDLMAAKAKTTILGIQGKTSGVRIDFWIFAEKAGYEWCRLRSESVTDAGLKRSQGQ